MSSSPLLTPGTGERSHHRAPRRFGFRRRHPGRLPPPPYTPPAGGPPPSGGRPPSGRGLPARARVAGFAVVGLAIVGALALPDSIAKRRSASGPDGTPTSVAGAVDSSKPLPRSPTGLPLGTPPLALTGLGDTAADRVRPGFRAPPRAGLLFNLESGEVLWQRHPTLRAPIASLTKMMTALLTVRHEPPSARVLITRRAEDMPGSRVGVLPLGRRVPVEPVLYGLLLPSGNDAAVALSEAVAGSQRRFVAEMNGEAARLGLGCTRYSNPSGYYDRGNFSCPVDLAELAYTDLSQPRIARVVAAREAILPFPIKGGKLYLYNNNPLLMYRYRGADGVKTGWTEAAGTCLVASAERHGVRLGVVLLHSPAPGTQAQQLLDEAFGYVYHQRTPPEPRVPGGA